MQIEAIKKNEHYEVPDLNKLNIDKDRVTLYFDYESYLQDDKLLKGSTPEAQPDSLQAIFNEILGKNAQIRDNVSIGEDRKNVMRGLWDKHGQ